MRRLTGTCHVEFRRSTIPRHQDKFPSVVGGQIGWSYRLFTSGKSVRFELKCQVQNVSLEAKF